MPFDSGGNFSRAHSWVHDRDNNIRILASRMDEEFNNFAAGMNEVFLRNGLVPMTAALNMNSNPIINISTGSVTQPGLRFAGDNDSGLFQTGDGNVSIATNGVKAASFNSDGLDVPGISFDPNFGLYMSGLNPVLGVDNTDFMYYERSSDTYIFAIGGAQKFTMGATNARVVSGSLFVGSGNFLLVDDGTNSIFRGDTTDYMSYNRTLNRFDFVIGGTGVFGININQIDLARPIVYFNSDAQYYTRIQGGNPIISFDGNDFLLYDRTDNRFRFFVNSVPSLEISQSNVVSTGHMRTPAASLIAGEYGGGNGSIRMSPGYGGGNTGSAEFANAAGTRLGYLGNISTAAGPQQFSYVNETGGIHAFNSRITTPSVLSGELKIDAQGYFTMGGSGPLLNFDADDYVYYNRAGNEFHFIVGGVRVMQLNSNGDLYTRGNVTGNWPL